MPLPLKHFYMIRHGETEANRAHIMAGSLDSPLTQLGRDQAKDAANIVAALDIKPSVIVHSNLSRARDTAGIINEQLDVPMFEDADIAEFHSGDWEGVPYEECQELLNGWPTPPNGESFDTFTARLKRGKSNHLSKHDGPILIVSHGGVFRGFGGLYGLQPPCTFRNCHLYEFSPNISTPSFPWDVWSYEHCGTREVNSIFHDSELLETA